MKQFILFFSLIFSLLNYSQSFFDIEANIQGVSFGAAAFADFDQDGRLDFVLTGSNAPNSSMTKLYKNDGSSFVEVTGTGFPNITLGSVEWGDFNNDNYPDLLIAGYIEVVEVAVTKLFKNNGDGTFTDMALVLPRVYQGASTWADINNDGFLDFALSGFDEVSGSTISKIYRNNQDETFTELTAVNLPGTLYGKIKWADYNNDTYQDFVLTGFGPTTFITEIWTNNGDETFTKSSIALQKCWLGDVAWGDYDNDNFIDLFVTGDNGGTKYSILYKNNGDGTFTDEGGLFPGLSHSSVEWADFDSDGDLDLFLAGTGDAMGSGDYFGVLFKNNAGVFTESTYLPGTYWGECIATDFNNDGYPDLLLNGYDSGETPFAALYKNDGVTFVEELDFSFSLYPNPASQTITISNTISKLTKISITDLSGKIVYSENFLTNEKRIDVSCFNKGIYIVSLHSKMGVAYKKLLIK